MEPTETLYRLANNHISVDCVVVGFDGDGLCVLLVKRDGVDDGGEFHGMKLPGSLIYEDEDLDEAAARVLFELTGLKNVNLMQFKAFGSKNRTNDSRDVLWLERAQKVHVDRIVTVGYVALVKLDRANEKQLVSSSAFWTPVAEIGTLAFDHNQIVSEALLNLRGVTDMNPSVLFELLPRKFTAAQFRSLYEILLNHKVDARNFHKKIALMDYVVPLEERQQGVAHRAARYYKFDRKKYNRSRR
ncbi:MAG: NUDIX hydrolase [Bacteroides sp.]|nr:NUDIX hydrolase [Bacteroides sp.]